MHPNELVRQLKTDLTQAIWRENIAIKNGDPASSVSAKNSRTFSSNCLLNLAKNWNDKTVPLPLCEQK